MRTSAPEPLLALPGNCGPISAWIVLCRFSVEAPAAEVIRACRHTEDYGTFMIALSVGLQELGLSTEMYTDLDEDPKPVEEHCYRLAGERGIRIRQAIDDAFDQRQAADRGARHFASAAARYESARPRIVF